MLGYDSYVGSLEIILGLGFFKNYENIISDNIENT